MRCYTQYLQDSRESEKKEKKNEELQQLENEVMTLNTQCENLNETIQCLTSQYHASMTKVGERDDMLCVVQGNALKRKSDDKADLIVGLKKRIVELEEKKKELPVKPLIDCKIRNCLFFPSITFEIYIVLCKYCIISSLGFWKNNILFRLGFWKNNILFRLGFWKSLENQDWETVGDHSSSGKWGPKPNIEPVDQLFIVLIWLRNGFTLQLTSWVFNT